MKLISVNPVFVNKIKVMKFVKQNYEEIEGLMMNAEQWSLFGHRRMS